MTGKPVCQSGGTGVCYDQATVLIPQPGYGCQSNVCVRCSIGTYSPDGRKCNPCPFGTWSPNTGSGSCSKSFSYATPGLQKVHIPFGVNMISVKLWGGGGASDKSSDSTYVSHSGGGGGFSLCNLTVAMSSTVYVLVAGGGSAGSQPLNPGGYGGGGTGFTSPGYLAGGGGGRSAVQLVQGTDVITAGGGGGGADCLRTRGCGGGGGGGILGDTPRDSASGRGGSGTSGGAPGFGFFCNGTAGTKYQGGDGCKGNPTSATAGGGGGYYGGGGGSAFGTAETSMSIPPKYPADGGGGGGSSYGGGCEVGTFLTLQGATGNSFNTSRSGGNLQSQYLAGVGTGGAAGGIAGGPGFITLHYVPDSTYLLLSPNPTSFPSSSPTGQPTGQPSARPTRMPSRGPSGFPSGQPTSRPSYAHAVVVRGAIIGNLTTQMAIIIFSCVGAAVLILFMLLTCYFQFRHLNKVGETVHTLVEENYCRDEVDMDDEGGAIVDHESMFYRQFGDISSFGDVSSPSHCFKDKEGNLIPITTGRSSGANSVNKRSSNGSFSGQSRQSFVLRKSFGGVTPSLTDADSVTPSIYGDFSTMKRGSFGASGSSLDDFTATAASSRRGSFGIVSNSRQKYLTRTSISTIGTSVGGGGDNNSLNGDVSVVSVKTDAPANRSQVSRRSASQVMSSVRVKSFAGAGPAPRLVKLQQSSANQADIAKARYIAEHENDVQSMATFFRRCGLSMQKSIICAEEAICLDANSPRKLFKYVHEVVGFSLMNLGMDRIDTDLVMDMLSEMFSLKDISAASAAAAAVAKMMGGSASPMGSTKDNQMKLKPVTISMIQNMKPEMTLRASKLAEHEDDVLNMMEFFRFAGLGIKHSKECAEQSICMDANSPRKLFKYLQEVKGFYLTDLSMDALEADMVLKLLMKEFGTKLDNNTNSRGKRENRKNSISSAEYDYKSDSSGGYNSRNEVRMSPVRNTGSSKVSFSSKSAQKKQHKAPFTAPPARMAAFSPEMTSKARHMLDIHESPSPDTSVDNDNDHNQSYIEYKEEDQITIHTHPAPSFASSEIFDTSGFGAMMREKTYEESMGMFSRSSFSNGLLPGRINCYFTHDWSTDELQRSNQKQIHRIDEVMRSRGLTTIVDTDSQHLAVTPQHKMKICQNIDECESILIFVTSKFMGKVNGMDGNNDICKVEYEHALRTASSKLVIVILEERMKFLSQWKGALRKCIGDSTKLIDMTNQEDKKSFDFHMNELIQAVAIASAMTRGR